ncbi:MAG TPA: hypothetical protein VHV79_13890 [Mycobacteriales bacterium]|jgi:hypothetical protein|nr:hypothetical protein [Mycobacteriales bacterium]
MTTTELLEEQTVSVEPTSVPPRSTASRRATKGVTGRSRLMAAGSLALVAVVAAGCGSSGSTASPNAPAASPSSSASANGGPGTGRNGQVFRRFVPVAGKVVSINSAGAQVQTSTGTSTVAWASSTRFSKIATISLAALVKGDCVTVSSTGNTARAASAITARTVSVTSTSGCARGLGRAGGGFGGGSGGGAPGNGNFGSAAPFGSGGSPRPLPSGSGSPGRGFGGPGFNGQGFGGAFGTVASVSGSSFVVTSLIGSKKVTVTTTPTTTFTATSSATQASLVTGTCASALGSKTSNGTVDALSITISTPTNGKCPAAPTLRGPGGFGGFGGARPPSGTASPGADNA